MEKKPRLWVAYLLAMFGDLNHGLLVTASILYGVILGASPYQNGLIGSAYGFTYLFMAALLGRLGDKMPIKWSLIFASIGHVSVSFYYVFFVSSIFQLISCQMILGISNAFFFQSLESYISENSDESLIIHQKAISSFCIYWSIGYMVGPFLAGIFLDNNIKIAFLAALIFYTINFLAVIFFLPSQKKHEKMADKTVDLERKDNNYFKTELSNETNSINKIVLIRILFGMLIFAMLSKVALTYFADYASRPDGLNLSGTQVGQILFIFGVGRTLYFLLSRYMKSSLKKISYSYIFISLLMLMLAFTNIAIIIGIIYFFIGIFCGLIYKSSLEILMLKENEAKGAKAGLFESAVGIGTAFSPIMAGLLGEIFLILPFFVFAAISFTFFLINLFLGKSEKKEDF